VTERALRVAAVGWARSRLVAQADYLRLSVNRVGEQCVRLNTGATVVRCASGEMRSLSHLL